MKRHPRIVALALAVFAAAAGAQPAAYPNKPIRLVIGFAPAGAADFVARSMSDALAKALGQPVVVDNKPGNGSSIAAEIDLAALQAKRLTLFGVSNKLRSKQQRAAAVPRFVAEVVPLIASGRIEPQIDRVVDFVRLPAAKARMEEGAHVGKIVLRAPAAS